MRPITTWIRVFQIAETIKAVSRWIDEHSVLPTIFQSNTREDEMLIVRIEFARDDEVTAFADASLTGVTNRPPTCEKRRREYLRQ